MFDLGVIAQMYLVATLCVGLLLLLSKRKHTVRVWFYVLASWLGAAIINDFMMWPLKMLALIIMDGFLLSVFYKMGKQYKLAWLMVLSVIHFLMTALHFTSILYATIPHQLIYNGLYILVLLSMITTVGERIVRFLDQPFVRFTSTWAWVTRRNTCS